MLWRQRRCRQSMGRSNRELASRALRKKLVARASHVDVWSDFSSLTLIASSQTDATDKTRSSACSKSRRTDGPSLSGDSNNQSQMCVSTKYLKARLRYLRTRQEGPPG